MKTESDWGVVLRLFPYGEFDTIATFFSHKLGKKIVLLRGFRRPKSRLSGIIQPFSSLSFEATLPRTETAFSKLSGAELLCSSPVKSDPILFFISEVSEKISRAGQSNPLFLTLLTEISTASQYNLLPCIFLVKTLTFFGNFPEFGFCSRTHSKLSEGGKWLPNGEVVSNTFSDFGISLNFSEIKIIRFWQKNSIYVSEKVSAEPETISKFMEFLLSYLEREIGMKLKTKEMLEIF